MTSGALSQHGERPSSDQIQALADAAADLARQDSPVHTAERVAQQARRAVGTCTEAGVLVLRSRGRMEAAAATGDLATECDRLQIDLGEGPWLRAVELARPVHVPHLAVEREWPQFAARARQLGVGSMLVLPLTAPRGVVGVLDLYADTPQAFTDSDELMAQAYATHAGIALAHAEMEQNLRIGLQTREEIGRAVGILMERHRITAPAAFDMLVVASQHSHRKLREVAARVNETGEDPSTAVGSRRRRGA